MAADEDDDEVGKEWQDDGKSRPRCHGYRRDWSQCTRQELPDLGFCFGCAPEDLIPLAEQLSGLKRCTAKVTSTNEDGTPHGHTGHRCGRTGNPVCKHHGGTLPQVKRAAFEDILNRTAQKEIRALTNVEQKTGMTMRLEARQPLANPFFELMLLAAEMKEFKEKIGGRVEAMNVEAYRYEHDRAGEQIRGEVMIYIKAMERLETVLTRIVKLGIEERMARVTERQQEIIEQALLRTLAEEKYAIPPVKQKEIMIGVARRLRVA